MWDKGLLVRCAKLLQAKYKVKQKKSVRVSSNKTRRIKWEKKLRSNKQNIVLCKRKTM